MSYKEKVNCIDLRKYNPPVNSNNLAKLKIDSSFISKIFKMAILIL